MNKLLIYLLMIGCLFISTNVFARGLRINTIQEMAVAVQFTKWTGTEYTVDADTLTFGWDAVTGATSYEVKAIWIDPTDDFAYELGSTTGIQMVITRPRTGHLVFWVRACNDNGCSEWSESTDITKAVVDGQPGAWRVYWKVPPPGGIIIE